MPAMISHCLLARRALRALGKTNIVQRRDAFLIGAQGPDLLFFHRVYPWQPGKASFRLGNALHEVQPSRLFDTLYALLDTTPPARRAVVKSYIQGFLCHYAADRTVHPFVCFWQEELRKKQPEYATIGNAYHHRIENALDSALLRHDTGQTILQMMLPTLLPPRDAARDAAIGQLYVRLLHRLFGVTLPEQSAAEAVDDMRTSLRLMSDHSGLKYLLIRGAEKVTGVGALLSPVLRTPAQRTGSLTDRDYVNSLYAPWTDWDGRTRTADFYTLCEEATAFTVKLLRDFEKRKSGLELTNEITFSGRRFRRTAE